MKVIVVGGGMSGLYVAYTLLQRGHNVILLERSKRLGGRVHSVEIAKGQIVETGAGRFNTSHQRLFKLIRDLDLMDKVTPITINERRFVKEGEKLDKKSEQSYDLYVKHILYDKLVNTPWKKQFSKSYLQSITLKAFMLQQLHDSKVVDNIINAFGYNSEFEIQNAFSSLTIMTNDFSDSIQYYYLQGGLSQITKALCSKIEELGGVIHMNAEVISYDPIDQNVFYKVLGEKHSVQMLKGFDKIVFCVTKSALLKFDFVAKDSELMKHLKGIQMAPLNRMFAKFPSPKEGQKFLLDFPFRITTSLPIRYIYPSNPTTHIGQISYTDNQFADYWKKQSINDVKQGLFVNLKKIFPNEKIDKPLWVKRFYWKDGVTYWLPNYKVYSNSKSKPYVIAGEIMSPTHSGWIEGALQGAEKALRAII